jgi:hypothetical protein
MPEELSTDTQDLTPPEGQEGQEPEGQKDALQGVEPQAVEQEPQAPPTPDELVERAAQLSNARIQSWMGRRDKDLMNQLGGVIEGLRSEIAQLKGQKGGVDPGHDPAAFDQFVENPSRWLDMEISRRQNANASRHQSIIGHAANIMESDSLFEDQELGREVIGEMVGVINTIPQNTAPDVAAKLLVSEALKGVVRKRGTNKGNAYAGKTAAKVPMGGVTPAAPKPSKPKLPPLSPKVKEYGKKWGYSDEDLAKLFADK